MLLLSVLIYAKIVTQTMFSRCLVTIKGASTLSLSLFFFKTSSCEMTSSMNCVMLTRLQELRQVKICKTKI